MPLTANSRWDGQQLVLVDTAGIRRRGKVERGVEKYSVLRALSAIERSDVTVLVLGCNSGCHGAGYSRGGLHS